MGGISIKRSGGVALAESAPCLTVNMQQPIVFPDGSEQAAGQLTLCDWKTYTPVAQLHRSYVNGQPIQMLLGRRTRNERLTSDPDEVYFRRDSAGRLVLLGYARTLRGRGVTVRFQRQDSPRRVNQALARAPERNDDLLIVMMARPH